MSDSLHVEVVSADRLVWSGEATRVIARTTEGDVGILPNHAPLLSLLVDGVVGPTPLDAEMLDWLRTNQLPHTVVATKHDKVKPSQRVRRVKEVAHGCQLEPGDVLWVSSEKGTGVDRLRSLILTWLE